MKSIFLSSLVLLGCFASQAGEPTHINAISTNGYFTVNCNRSHIYWAIEWAITPQGPWMPSEVWNQPVTGSNDTAELPLSDLQAEHAFFRVVSSPEIIIPPQGVAGFPTDTNRWGRVSGKVMFWEGNFMPTDPTGTITPVQRVLCFFEITHQVVHSEYDLRFSSFILSPFVASTKSDINGDFSLKLPPGDYSLFVIDRSVTYFFGDIIEGPDEFYANWGNASGICPVHVESNQTTVIQFDIKYLAAS